MPAFGIRGLRRYGIGLIVMAVGAGLVLVPQTSASATPPAASSTLAVTDGSGQTSTAVAVGDGLNVSTVAPISQVGQTGQQIQNLWDPSQLSVDPESIVAPEGWTLEYTTDGTNWSTDQPEDWSAVQGVRASGSVASDGFSNGLQVSTSTGGGNLVTGSSTFSGSSGGDGWDAFTSDTQVFNVWHHNDSSYNLDCHAKVDGTSCGDVYTRWGFETSRGSSGDVVNNKVYSYVGNDNDGTFGVLCTDVSTTPFTDCGYTSLLYTGTGSYDNLGTQALTGTKIYEAVSNWEGDAQLLCFDTATSSACDSQPYTVSGFNRVLPAIPVHTTAFGGNVYVTGNHIWCFDAATGNACEGVWPVGDYSGAINPAVPSRDNSGTVNGVCIIFPANDCYDLSGQPMDFPPALADLLAQYPVGAGAAIGWGEDGFGATQQYWFAGWWGEPNYPVCWSWATQSACANFNITPDNSAGYVRYALRVDSTNPDCVWSNGDNGQISSFDATSGTPGCVHGDPQVAVPYTTAVPRMGCAESGRIRSYEDLSLTAPDGVDVTSLVVTVRDSDGNAVPDFTELNPNVSGSIDLSALSPDVTGTHPSFLIKVPGGTTAQALAITAAVRYVSDAPQLCFTLASVKNCPTLDPGVSADSTTPVSDVVIHGQTVSTVGETATPTALSQTVTRADMGGCFGNIQGTVQRTWNGGSGVLAGETVELFGPDSSVLATTTTDSEGFYNFANVHQGDYTVRAHGQAGEAYTEALETGVTNISVPVGTPTDFDLTISTLQNTAGAVSAEGLVDDSTDIDWASVQIFDPVAETWGTSLAVDGEGTWNVDESGSITFTPLVAFTGDATPVTYRFADLLGQESPGSTVTATVLPFLPTAVPATASGVRGSSLSITPNGVEGAVALVPSSLKLIDPSTELPVSSLVVPHIGTFTVNTDTGMVDFVPVSGFVGTAQVVYQVTDTLDRTATSTMTVTLSPISLVGRTVTVGVGVTAHATVAGIPSGSVTSVPESVVGAASVTISGSHVTVVPAHGFSGRIDVPVTVVHGTATLVTHVIVIVRPAAVRGGHHSLTADGATMTKWSATPGATSYEVRVAGKVQCVTNTTSCIVPLLLGPAGKVQVTALGNDGVRGAKVSVPYLATTCVSVGAVHFGSGSSTLGSSAKSALKNLGAVIAKQGFKKGCLVGFTDNLGSAAYNLALSKQRVSAVGSFLTNRTPHTKYLRHYKGEGAPAAPNETAKGRASNRRVEMGVI